MAMAIVQMVTVDRVGCETVPVEVAITSTEPLQTTEKNLLVAAAKKFKGVSKQSRAYHGLTGEELMRDVKLDSLSGAFVVLSSKAGWKGAARLSAAKENATTPAAEEKSQQAAAPPGSKVDHVRWDGVFRGRIGIDVGGVLNQHNNDIESNLSKEWWLKRSSEAPNALCSVGRLVENFGPENVFIVSKLGSDMQRLTETWLLRTMDICSETGLLQDNIHFCTQRSGRQGKGLVANRLQLSHFIDDSFECLESVFSDAVGNAGEYVEQYCGKLVHFARSGLGTTRPERPSKLPKGMASHYSPVANWQEAMEVLVPSSSAMDSHAEKAGEEGQEDAKVREPSNGDFEAAGSMLLEAAQSERAGGVVLFWKDTQDNGYLSNWGKSPMLIDGIRYNCLEQWLMASKALTCKDEAMRDKVMSTLDPSKQKALGRSLDRKAVDRYWKTQVKWMVQLRGARAKFQQNAHLAVKLLRTGQKPIAEASPSDQIFGIGLAPNNKLAQDPANWNGMNLLGKALMQVREEIRQQLLAGGDLTSMKLGSPSELMEDIPHGQELDFPPSGSESVSEDEPILALAHEAEDAP